MSPVFSWGFYISVNMALLLGATPLLDFIDSDSLIPNYLENL